MEFAARQQPTGVPGEVVQQSRGSGAQVSRNGLVRRPDLAGIRGKYEFADSYPAAFVGNISLFVKDDQTLGSRLLATVVEASVSLRSELPSLLRAATVVECDQNSMEVRGPVE